MAFLSSRNFALLVACALFLPACDGTDDVSDVTINVAIEGNGTGRVEARTVGVNVRCNVSNGTVSGTCSSSYQDEGGGILRLEGVPDVVSNFTWGGDCRRATTRLCELSFESGQDIVFDVIGRFAAKTENVIVTPKPITMTTLGQEVVASAQALDENGAEVFGVTYTWTTSNDQVVTVSPLPNTRQANLVSVSNGSAVISATAQGITGQTQVDVRITN